MIKILISFFKKIVVAAVLLYTYNQFSVSFDAVIPINIFSIIFVSIFGVPAMIGLVLFNILFF